VPSASPLGHARNALQLGTFLATASRAQPVATRVSQLLEPSNGRSCANSSMMSDGSGAVMVLVGGHSHGGLAATGLLGSSAYAASLSAELPFAVHLPSLPLGRTNTTGAAGVSLSGQRLQMKRASQVAREPERLGVVQHS